MVPRRRRKKEEDLPVPGLVFAVNKNITQKTAGISQKQNFKCFSPLQKKDPSCCICLRDEEECAAVGISLGKCLKSQLPLCSRCSKENSANSAHSEAEREHMAQIPSAERRSALVLPMRIAAKKKSDPQLWEHIRWVRNPNFKKHFPLFFCFCVGMWHAAINYPFSPVKEGLVFSTLEVEMPSQRNEWAREKLISSSRKKEMKGEGRRRDGAFPSIREIACRFVLK